MKIEKINENQIRCFLSKQELDSRHLHLKELAYGTEKARALFQELMEEAFRQYGFIVENMPVMVEAVPLQDDSLVLIITRVENPEELDTRFSNFAPSVKSGGEDEGAKDSSSVLSQLLETIRRE
ncbi:MAG TPA: competence protein, partial [Sarcina sp.]|nr:competence protein [Sarcina sp.]